MNKLIFASLVSVAAMLAAQTPAAAPAEGSKAPVSSTSKVKKHGKKNHNKKAAVASTSTAKPVSK